MKKTYINPTIKVVMMKTRHQMLAGSPGVGTGKTLGDEYTEGDVSYGRGFDFDDEEY